ncbi:hypothetical protein [Fructilactobacillus fructivorans]|uniref:Uncharacterized protein n=2 Tax=Fructilactobacillus fructivorans TaxID=1614 RepID=A0AAE6TWT7_9LACO|nr:hypothetical protein [Fructilactobacillus fructivorans]KRK57506.1 hypothetical protein FC73_GL001053 [Fructilactobacillus fructivorans]QFX93181.1 hypothetical protein LF543_06365 [Fructilactobacillus fructivorans]RDV64797.1 hypothetical protein DXU76_06815 [Fructilactobacillus fructivorans]
MEVNDRYYQLCVPDQLNGYTCISMGFFKDSIYNMVIEIQYRLLGELIKRHHVEDNNYVNPKPYQPIFTRNNEELSKILINRFMDLQSRFGDQNTQIIIKRSIDLLQFITNTHDTYKLINSTKSLLRLLNSYIHFLCERKDEYVSYDNNNDRQVWTIDLSKPDSRDGELHYQKLTNNQFINLVSLLAQKIRHQNRKPTIDEYLSFQIAFQMINLRGYAEAPIVPWGNSGFRKVQTQASITDPGLGHITGTASDLAYIKGTNVHIEFLERGKVTNRERVEPYRLPDLRTIGEVKMLIGRDTSVSSYVGRPMFEDTFDNSFIKSVHTMIAACSSIFIDGLSECKIAIEKMTFMQAVKFMKAVAANVIRDSTLQVLAAAFCINYPIIDDRPETIKKNNGKPQKVTDPMKIAKLGIKITELGNFEKVTFDGTANWYPSDPIMEQLGYKNCLKLVHLAHQKGLLTYFSAGFRFRHLNEIVLSGTDGIGLGGAQILRFMDKRNGNQGPFKEENILKILKLDKKAAESPLGEGTQLLCRLDRMFYELSLPAKFLPFRKQLYEALYNRNFNEVKAILNKCHEIVSMKDDTAHPLVEWANRLLNNYNICIAFMHMSSDKENVFLNELSDCVARKDYDQLKNILCQLKLEY